MSTTYEQTITEIRDEAARLRSMCERGIYPMSLFDTYLRSAEQRSDYDPDLFADLR
jgi:hypothetical protein